MYICAQFMSYLLHIDSSADLCGIAVSRNGIVISSAFGAEARNHAANINNLINTTLAAAQIELTDIAAVAVCSGPGSYTGLRIAMATAKGICYALEKPMILSDKPGLLARQTTYQQSGKTENIAIVLLAREQEYFIGIYNTLNETIVAPVHVTEKEMLELLHKTENLHIVSELGTEHFYQLKVNFSTVDANIKLDYQSWATVANEAFKCQEFVNPSTASPLYLKQVYTHK